MKKQWPIEKIGNIAQKIAMGPFGSNIKVDNFVLSGVPVLNGANLTGVTLKEDSFNYVTEQKAEELKNSLAYRGDIVVTHRGTLGQIVYIPKNSKFEKYLISQSQFLVRLNSDKADCRFITYFFHSAYGKYLLLSNASQVGVPALARPTTTFKLLEMALPSLGIQKKIADFLCRLDDKIELNTKINHNLEEQAKAIFKSWFVDFEPFKNGKFVDSELGPIPEGWKVDDVYHIASVIYGAPFASKLFTAEKIGKPIIRIRDLVTEAPQVNTPEVHPKGYLVRSGDIVVGMDGEFKAYVWGGDDAWLNQRVCVFKPKEGFSPSFVRYTIMPSLAAVEASEVATTVIHLGKNDIDKFKALIPAKDTLDKFNGITSHIHAQIVQHKIESRRLAALRETLLPKLMSGEIDVSEIEV